MNQLNTSDHSRDAAAMTYVYPVVSRRSGGVSVGVNLNPNNACNWRCIYCQVPDLKRGGPPPIDLARLETELRRLLSDIVHGDFMQKRVPASLRRLNDVALSGNGEPTTAAEFPQAVECIGRVLTDLGLLGKVRLVLITNGSQLHRVRVREGIARMAAMNGEVWFKLDRAGAAGLRQVNDARITPQRVYGNLASCSTLCPTWVQTCLFALDGQPPAKDEVDAYLDLLRRTRAEGLPLAGVLLYGLARPSLQAQAPRLSALPADWMDALAGRIRELGLAVRVHP